MRVFVEGGTEVVDEGDGTDLGGHLWFRSCAGASLQKGLFDHAQHKAERSTAERRVALQEGA